jgi:hypothetical protein
MIFQKARFPPGFLVSAIWLRHAKFPLFSGHHLKPYPQRIPMSRVKSPVNLDPDRLVDGHDLRVSIVPNTRQQPALFAVRRTDERTGKHAFPVQIPH